MESLKAKYTSFWFEKPDCSAVTSDWQQQQKKNFTIRIGQSSDRQKCFKNYQHIHITYFSAIFDFWKSWKSVRSEKYNFQGRVKKPYCSFYSQASSPPSPTHTFVCSHVTFNRFYGVKRLIAISHLTYKECHTLVIDSRCWKMFTLKKMNILILKYIYKNLLIWYHFESPFFKVKPF